MTLRRQIAAPVTLAMLGGLATGSSGCINREAMAQEQRCGMGNELTRLDVSAKLSQASASRADGAVNYADLYLSFPLNGASDPPLLMVTATAGEGAFANGVVPGSFELRGEDVDPLRCGLCITLIGPLDAAQEQPSYTYAAVSGSLQLERVGGESIPRVKGTLEHVRLHQVERDERTGRFTPRTCNTRIREVRFDLPLEEIEREAVAAAPR